MKATGTQQPVQTAPQAGAAAKPSVKERLTDLLFLLLGLIIAHFGVTLFLLTELGSDPFTTFVQGVSRRVHLSIGVCHVAILILLMVIMMITAKGYIRIGSAVCAFCGGWIIDFFKWLIGDRISGSTDFWIRIAVMLLGCGILSFGMSIVIESRAGTGPNDLIAIILTDKLYPKLHLQFRWVRILCDCILIGIGFCLGGRLGIGTIAAACLVGPLVQMFLPTARRLLKKEPQNVSSV